MDNLLPSEARCVLTSLFKELSMSHKELIDRHMDAIVAGDLDTLLSDYDDRSVSEGEESAHVSCQPRGEARWGSWPTQ